MEGKVEYALGFEDDDQRFEVVGNSGITDRNHIFNLLLGVGIFFNIWLTVGVFKGLLCLFVELHVLNLFELRLILVGENVLDGWFVFFLTLFAFLFNGLFLLGALVFFHWFIDIFWALELFVMNVLKLWNSHSFVLSFDFLLCYFLNLGFIRKSNSSFILFTFIFHRKVNFIDFVFF